MITKDRMDDAIDAMISNAGADGLFVDDFMRLLSTSEPEAQELMMKLHEQGKLELKWVKGRHYKST